MSDSDIRMLKASEWRWTDCAHDHWHIGNGAGQPHGDDGQPVHHRGDSCCEVSRHVPTRTKPDWFERTFLGARA